MSLDAVMETTLTVGVDDLLRAVFFRHVRKAAAPLQNVGGRVVKEHYEEGIVVMPLIMLFNKQIAYEISLVILKQFLNKRSTIVR